MSGGYVKIFESIYDGTLADNWQAMVTFQQLLILCDQNGIVDMTPGAIHRRTGIPLDIITAGLAVLTAPDPQSRSPLEEGRRIVPLDPARSWGWRLVNHAHYRALMSAADKREADRVRIAEKRKRDEARQPATRRDTSQASQSVADVAHTEASTDTEAVTTTTEGIPKGTTTRATGVGGDPPEVDTQPTAKAAIGLALRAAGFALNHHHALVDEVIARGIGPDAVLRHVLAARKAGKKHPVPYGLQAAISEFDDPPKAASAIETKNQDAAARWLAAQGETHATA